ncbi:2-deoxy-D-gluconate 3-dehydrogenase [Microbacterium sp. SORGH_AS428]|uniref:SDR family oxidoreductase n=1 Tax=Microbacterium sp. SORGH_AS_0428 TaxID=3041788 RepID=UPI002863F61F|nr:SDR family oxidoreductase [Microbacterium sp. SORGH_AS_0428]MDR6199776.1 2-deoxy-D-gluconate 3-dehydrogenase [Microbacterium sp. SORGH_AS_0428]
MSGLFDLTGLTAVVTGARRGIGSAMALALAEAGADIIGVSASQASSGSEIERAVTELGRGFEGIACDFSDPIAVEALARSLAERRVDILVNNAGTIERAPAARHPLSSWDRVLQINLSAPFVLAQAIGGQMLARGRGKIIFTASLLSFQGGINVPGYTAAKSGIAGLTKALSNEWSAQGVNVNAIAPGYIATDNTQALRDDPDRSAAILERIPAARWGRPDDLAGATVFLASRASDYVDGITLPVDGGWLGR